MSDLKIKTQSGGSSSVKSDAVQKLTSGIQGQVLSSGLPGYDEARTIWNAMIDRKPALIVRCANAQDVVQAIRFAREHGLLTAIKGGGHNIAGNAVCDAGLMVDLSLMKGVKVDVAGRKARVEAGATLGDFDAEAQKYGLATPLGINSTTGVAGLTLGGGFGWLSRKYGLTIDNLISADVVTAAGDMVKASATDNPELFWAIRGGGGNFGVVTAFEFRLHAVGPEVLSGLIVHPLDDAKDVLRQYRDFVAKAPDEMAVWFVMRLAPPLPFLPPEWHGKGILALAMCYCGSLTEGEKVAAPLRAIGKPLADVVGPHPFIGWQQALDPLLTPGARNYWKSHDFAKLDDGLIDVFIDFAKKIPDPQAEIAFAQLGGAVNKVAFDSTAYGHRDAQFVMNVHGRWAEPSKDEAVIGWARGLFQAAAPFSTGAVYVNFMTGDEGDRVKAAYGKNYDRLAKLKNKYDPTNLFCMNQNIKPVVTA